MINSRSFITGHIIRSELALLIQVPVSAVEIKQSGDFRMDTLFFHVRAKGAEGYFEFPCTDLALSLDEFSFKHITPYVARMYGSQAIAT